MYEQMHMYEHTVHYFSVLHSIRNTGQSKYLQHKRELQA